MKFTYKLLISLLIAINTTAYPKDLGVMGETYSIIEEDFLDYIEKRAELMNKNGQWEKVQTHIKENATKYRDRPVKVKNISKATSTHTFDFDPSIILDNDIFTHDGKLVARAGTHVNPLSTINITKTLIFYDGDDQDQVTWVMKEDIRLKGKDKLILINGSILSQEEIFKKQIYFDQGGKLTAHFGIKHVPATVTQEALILKIKEICV